LQFVTEVVIGYDVEHKAPLTCAQTMLDVVDPTVDGRVPLYQAGYDAPQLPVLGGDTAN
jgi:hypothetical protein